MKRAEQIEKAAAINCCGTNSGIDKNCNTCKGFLAGAEWADKNPNFIDELTYFSKSDIDYVLKNEKLTQVVNIYEEALEYFNLDKVEDIVMMLAEDPSILNIVKESLSEGKEMRGEKIK